MNFVVSMMVRTSILLICAGGISLVVGRRVSAAGRHRIWNIAIWAVLALPALSLLAPKLELPILPPREAPRTGDEFQNSGEPTYIVAFETPADASLPPRADRKEIIPAAAPRVRANEWLLLVWGIGALVVLTRSLLGFREVRRLRRSSAGASGGEWETRLAELRSALGISTPVELRTTDQGIPPMTWGVFRPVILMPSLSRGWTEERRRLVLAHELSHVKRKDGQTQIVTQVACSLYWFNPLVWYTAHRMRIERERACDDFVLGLGAEADDYADHLLEIARTLNSGLSFATVSIAHPSDLEARLRAILDPLTRRGSLGRFTGPALVLSLAVLTATTAVLQLTALAPIVLPSTALPSFASAALPAPPQPAVPATPVQLNASASVSGSVSKLGSGEALPGTQVELVKSPGGNTAAYSTLTTGDGAFLFSDVQPGEYRVLATREDGLLPAEYGQKSPGVRGLQILVHAADSIKNIRLAMASPGAISGRIFDHDGEPVGNAKVQALKTTYWQGKRVLSIAESVQTNDVGEYRLFWLAPGQYFITAKPVDTGARSTSMYIRPPADRFYHDETTAPAVSRHVLANGEVREEVYPASYYPGTPDFEAARPIALNSGDNLLRMDITVANPVAARHVFGTVIDGSTGQPAASATLRAIPRDGNPSVVVPNGTANGNGEFNIEGLAAGSYDLFASLATKAGPGSVPAGASGRLPIEVGSQDLRGLTIIVPSPFDLPGRLVVDGKTDADFDITRLKVYLQRDPDVLGMPFAQPPTRPGTPDPGATQPDGSFILSGIGPGDYKISATYTGVTGNGPAAPGLRPGTFLKSLTLGNADVLNGGLHLTGKPEAALQIVIGTTQAQIDGSVVNEKSEAVPNAFVVLVPDVPFRRRTDLYKTVGTSSSGSFSMRSIAPGGYTLFAFEDVQNGAWFDPDFLKNFESRGTHLEINQASQENRQLIVIDAQR